MIEAYLIHLAILICIYIILAVSLQVSFGYAGILNLGHVAFFGIGAYTSAILSLNGLPFLIALCMAVVVSGIFGWGLSIATRKLKGDYVALLTLGFSFVMFTVFLNWRELTGGSFGLPGIPRPDIFGVIFSDNMSFFVLTLVITILSYIFIHRVCNSSFGRSLEAVRDDELAAQSLGKNTKKLKAVSLVISACFAGVAGSLFAAYLTFIDPSSFSFATLIPVLLIVIIGGLASLPGTVTATFIIILLPEFLRLIGMPSSILGPARQMLFAVLLLVVLYYLPRGFYGKIELE